MQITHIFSSAFMDFPVKIHFGNLGNVDYIPQPDIYKDWGDAGNMLILKEGLQAINTIELLYYSYCERKLYYINEQCYFERNNIAKYQSLVLGFAPYGKVVVWNYDKVKSVVLCSLQCPELDKMEYKEYIANFTQDGVNVFTYIPYDLFNNYMKQFIYRYQARFEKWDEGKWEKYKEYDTLLVFDYIEEALYDGTHDKLHDGGLMKYHEAGKPKKLKVQFHVGKAEYSAYFWFEDERIKEVFDRFYGAHPDTKTDFIIKIDAERNKYQVAMYRYGLKEPVVLADDVFQLIVFRNKFECYRSENYNQPRGAWIW